MDVNNDLQSWPWVGDGGLDKSRAIVKFEEDELATEYVDTGTEIEDLKKEYIKQGG